MTMVLVAALLCAKLAGPPRPLAAPGPEARELAVRELLTDQSYVLAQSVGMDDFYARLPLDKELWRPVNLNWNRQAHAGIRKKYHSVTSYLKGALYKGWDDFNKYVNKHLALPAE